MRCAMGQYCSEHGTTHGSEAEELRARFEELICEYEGDPHEQVDGDAVARKVRRILDEVDARDSLAYLQKSSEEEE